MTGYLKQSPLFLQFVTFLGFFFGFTFLYLFGLQAIIGPLTGHSLAELQSGDLTDPNLIGYLKIIQLFYSIVTYFIPAALFCYLWQPYPVEYLGVKPGPRGWQIVLSLMAIYSVLWAAGLLNEWNQTWPVPQEARQMQAAAERVIKMMLSMPRLQDLFVNLFLVGIVPAIAEELFFRGVLQRLIIKSTRKVWLGVFITAVIFSAMHGEILGFMARVILGFVLGAIYVISGNLWLSIFAHILNNGMQVVMMYLFQHGMTKTDPTKDTPVEWYIGLLSAAVTVGLLWALKKKSDDVDMTDRLDRPDSGTDANSIGMDEN
ncbi:MAG TPA: CPBP family intramembrane glutamic endopeptidase [Chitinophaga sp.]|uniref:CPBP family intramembrane glutamic endopeptidase n=1 Tax=Chitinophaga sp. TaxID=1869181 RepID=UPI002D1BB69B|nr:CPBP family intramembrane glutamic endopeptidase [Chitinophaga sp.]HVI43903.1 CPBP family intramembrane glutamic endopeptidase [Chitinophaga sp.]